MIAPKELLELIQKAVDSQNRFQPVIGTYGSQFYLQIDPETRGRYTNAIVMYLSDSTDSQSYEIQIKKWDGT